MNKINPFQYKFHHSYALNTWKPKSLSDYIYENVVYNEKGLIVLNKPYGVSFSENSVKKLPNKNIKIINEETNLVKALPHLKQIFGYPELYTANVPEKYTSGVAILTNNKELALHVKLQLSHNKSSGNYSHIYQAVCIGHPVKEENEFKGAVTLRSKGNHKKAVLIHEWSKNAEKRRDVKKIKICHKLLSASAEASLLEIRTLRNTWHAIRVYLASEMLCPLLGDNLYSSQVKYILGKAVTIDPFNPTSFLPQRLPLTMKEKLDLKFRENIEVPVHLHISEVSLKNLFEKGDNYIFKVSVPHSFKWTCEKLNLNQDKCENLNTFTVNKEY